MQDLKKKNLANRFVPLLVFALLFSSLPSLLYAQEDVRALKEEIRRMREESERQRQRMQALEEKLKKIEAKSAEDTEAKQKVAELEKKVQGLSPGFANFLITGYGQANYNDGSLGNSNWNAGFNPVFLWSLNDKLFFEAELEFELEERETETNLEYAQLHWLVNDYITLGAGKFLMPFGQFQERLHPAWINKLPSAPIPFGHHGGIAPLADFGVQVRGGVPLFGEAKANFAFYVTNGPELLTSGHHAGELRFGNASDNNNNKAFGGRIGFLPVPELEVGLSYMRARVGSGSYRNVDADLFGADVSYIRDSRLLRGVLDLRFDYVQQWIDNATYTGDGQTFNFNNSKSGWYTQVAYRPSRVEIPILRDLEGIFRYTNVKWPSGTRWDGGVDQQQFALGVSYWLKPNAVFKLGYDIADNEGSDDENFFRIQFSYGF